MPTDPGASLNGVLISQELVGERRSPRRNVFEHTSLAEGFVRDANLPADKE